MIELRSVRRSFGRVTAVDGISFATRDGEIFGLLGPNGAGKSTTIKMIMNILRPDAGEILFNGSRIRESDKDRIGYLPEERGLYRKVKIDEMLLYLASLKNAHRPTAEKRLDEWLARFDLLEWKTRTPDTLSKGMAQKVQFIAAVLHDPEFVFLDEPFSGLDPGEHRRAAGGGPGARGTGDNDPLLHAQHGGRGEDLLAAPRHRSRPRAHLGLPCRHQVALRPQHRDRGVRRHHRFRDPVAHGAEHRPFPPLGGA